MELFMSNNTIPPTTKPILATTAYSLPEIGYIRQSQLLKIFPIGKTTLWAGVKTGRFPKPIKLGGRITAWKVEDIRACIENYNQNGGK